MHLWKDLDETFPNVPLVEKYTHARGSWLPCALPGALFALIVFALLFSLLRISVD